MGTPQNMQPTITTNKRALNMTLHRTQVRFPVLIALILTLITLYSVSLAGAKPAVNTNKSGLALNGYDVVAYFRDDKPVMGQRKFSYMWMKATWYFSSKENLELFKEEPQKYAPKYGGYCAYAVGNDYTYPADPLAWKIVDGKLYLNANGEVQQLWMKDIPGYVEKADKNWPAVLKK